MWLQFQLISFSIDFSYNKWVRKKFVDDVHTAAVKRLKCWCEDKLYPQFYIKLVDIKFHKHIFWKHSIKTHSFLHNDSFLHEFIEMTRWCMNLLTSQPPGLFYKNHHRNHWEWQSCCIDYSTEPETPGKGCSIPFLV